MEDIYVELGKFDSPLYNLTTLPVVVFLSSFSLRFSTQRACALSLSLILILSNLADVYLKSIGLCYIPKPGKYFDGIT
ncbi:hypothetical protein BGX38DRAFT_419767 [Terfezia claveryi]|nr:hypothetical protein BGX38DRAFT_419767 [Terfezia claveryi]